MTVDIRNAFDWADQPPQRKAFTHYLELGKARKHSLDGRRSLDEGVRADISWSEVFQDIPEAVHQPLSRIVHDSAPGSDCSSPLQRRLARGEL